MRCWLRFVPFHTPPAPSAPCFVCDVLFPLCRCSPLISCPRTFLSCTLAQSALDLTGYGGRVVLGSWYGGGAAQLNLGMAFHRSHLTIQTSQARRVRHIRAWVFVSPLCSRIHVPVAPPSYFRQSAIFSLFVVRIVYAGPADGPLPLIGGKRSTRFLSPFRMLSLHARFLSCSH